MNHKVVLSLGSNHGDRYANIEEAITWCAGKLNGIKVSSIYETPEIHGIGDPYLNAVVIGESCLSFEELTAATKEFERTHGRDAEARHRGEVPIDIDIVIWDEAIIRPLDFSRQFFQIGYLEISAIS